MIRSPLRTFRLFALALAVSALFGTVFDVPALAAPPDVDVSGIGVPEPLEPWVPWVLAKHPDVDCPWVRGQRLCAWPGLLELDLDGRGGTFRLEVHVDREMDLALPGSRLHWPRDVTADGRPALLRRSGGGPVVRLDGGRHRLEGRFRWPRLPQALPLPQSFALVDLTIDDRAVPFPRREASGALWLVARREEAAEDRLTVEVHRRIDDGVPVLLTTRVLLRVGGGSREVDLGEPLPDGFSPVELSGGLPLRFTEDRRLVVQLRPGEWEIVLRARSEAPVRELGLAGRPEPWPEEELWVFDAAPTVRSVRVTGAPAVDPQRTALPADWKSLPTYRLEPGDALAFDVLERGEPRPAPDEIRLHRTLWLEQAYKQLSVRDELTGTLHQGGRLDVLPPGKLGRFTLANESALTGGQLITRDPGGESVGVELRGGELSAEAQLTYDRGGPIPAVGWNRDVQTLSAELRLPLGWSLLAATGVDTARGSWIERFTLLDFFFLLVIALATWKLDGVRPGVVAFTFLVLAWQEPYATGLWIWWLLALPLIALLRVRTEGKLVHLARRLRWLVLLGFAIQLVVFVGVQWRTGLFPELEKPPHGAIAGNLQTRHLRAMAYSGEAAPSLAADIETTGKVYGIPDAPPKYSGRRARQVDADAVVQTGPGLPDWQWRRVSLAWGGPVTADQEMRLILISPALELGLSLLRIVGAIFVAWLLFGRWSRGEGDAAGKTGLAGAGSFLALLLVLLTVPFPATAQEPLASPPEEPSRALLDELETRLMAAPFCAPSCIEVPRMTITADASGLQIVAEVHAAAAAAWRLPGPATVWTPASLTVDGEPAAALRLGDDGFFLLRHDAGRQRVELRGPARDSLALQLPFRPRVLEVRADGYSVDGVRPDEPPPGTVRLDRLLEPSDKDIADAVTGEPIVPEPWLELRRELDVGIPWLVHTELVRHGPPGTAVSVRMSLLPGEAVTTAGVPVEAGETGGEGEAIVRLEADESSRRFTSTLDETEALELVAPEDRPWLETWTLRCSPIWHCQTDGLAPVRHMTEGVWLPTWKPWPGEGLSLAFTRPAPADGQAITVEEARLVVRPGPRLLEADLELVVRLTRGGEQTLSLPAEATLQSFTIDDESRPVQMEEGRLAFTLEPGQREVRVSWRQSQEPGFGLRVPEVVLGRDAVNVTTNLGVPPKRWLLWAGGPGWGPVVELWQYLLVILLLAVALGRWGQTPLGIVDWALLGAGLTQIPLPAAATVIVFFLVVGRRERLEPRRWWTYDLLQLVLAALTFAALLSLYAAVHSGLLFQPDMQVVGPGSSASSLTWYVDRVGDTLPRPWILSLPLWTWRILMLAWSLWLASRVLRWVPWGWQKLAAEPFLLGPKGFRRWRDDDTTDDDTTDDATKD